jgi:hypothetical protein
MQIQRHYERSRVEMDAARHGTLAKLSGRRMPMRVWRWLLLCTSTLLASCGSLQLLGTVTQFHQLDGAPKTFAIMPMDSQRQSLEFQQYAQLVKGHLQAKGWREAPFDAAAIGVLLQYNISSGRQVTFSYPILGAVPSGTSYTTGSINTQLSSPNSAYSTVTTTTRTGTTLGVVGSGVGSRIEFDRAVRIDMVSLPEYRQTQKVASVYEGTINSTGRTGELAAVMPTLIHGIFEDFPGRSGGTRVTSLFLTQVGPAPAAQPVAQFPPAPTPVATPVPGGARSERSNLSAAGLYDGTADANRPFTVLVLDSGRFYGLYAPKRGTGTLDAGFMVGDGVVNGATFMASNFRDHFLEGNVMALGRLDSTFSPKASMSGTIAYARGQRTSFTGGYSGAFEGRPSIAAVQGEYRGTLGSLKGSTDVALSLSPSGVVRVTSPGGCEVDGTVAPHPGGNLYIVRATLGAKCPHGTQTLEGHAFSRDGTLYAILTNDDMTSAIRLIIGKR